MKEMIDMRKIWKIFGIGLLLAIIATASAFGYQNSTYANSDLQNEDLIQKAYGLLERAEIREVQGYADTHYLLIADGKTVGVLWKDVDLRDITVGKPFIARWGAKVPLMVGEEVVGQTFIKGEPFDWTHPAADSEINGSGWHGCNCDCSQKAHYGSQNGYGHMYGHRMHGHYGEGCDNECGQCGQYAHNVHHGYGGNGERPGWHSEGCELFGYPAQGR